MAAIDADSENVSQQELEDVIAVVIAAIETNAKSQDKKIDDYQEKCRESDANWYKKCEEVLASLRTTLEAQISSIERISKIDVELAIHEAVASVRILSGAKGDQGIPGIPGKDGSQDTPDQIVHKVNQSTAVIKKERVEGLIDLMMNLAANAVASVGITTNFFNGLRAKNLTIVGATATQRGDTVFVTVSNTGGGQVNSIVAGTGISVDSADPANPIVSTTGTGFTVLTPSSGVVNGTNTVFVFASAPSVIVLDNGNVMNKVSSDGTVNWTTVGTTVTLSQAPSFNIFGF